MQPAKLINNTFAKSSLKFEREVLNYFPKDIGKVTIETKGFGRRINREGILKITVDGEVLNLMGESLDSSPFWIRNAILNTLKNNYETLRQTFIY